MGRLMADKFWVTGDRLRGDAHPHLGRIRFQRIRLTRHFAIAIRADTNAKRGPRRRCGTKDLLIGKRPHGLPQHAFVQRESEPRGAVHHAPNMSLQPSIPFIVKPQGFQQFKMCGRAQQEAALSHPFCVFAFRRGIDGDGAPDPAGGHALTDGHRPDRHRKHGIAARL